MKCNDKWIDSERAWDSEHRISSHSPQWRAWRTEAINQYDTTPVILDVDLPE